MEIQTTKLNNGAEVLAKTTKYGLNAVSYTNYTQAEKKAEELRANGINCAVIGAGRVCKYVAILD